MYSFFFGGQVLFLYIVRGVAPRWRRDGAAVAPRLRRGVSGGAAVVPRSRRGGGAEMFKYFWRWSSFLYGQLDRPVIAWLGQCAFYILLPSAQVTTPNPGHEQTLCAATHQESMLQHFIIDHSIF